jgi:hypothetical protein
MQEGPRERYRQARRALAEEDTVSITPTTRRASATDAELTALSIHVLRESVAEITKCLARAQDGIDAVAETASERGFDDYTEADLRFARTRIDAATMLLGIMRNTLGNR